MEIEFDSPPPDDGTGVVDAAELEAAAGVLDRIVDDVVGRLGTAPEREALRELRDAPADVFDGSTTSQGAVLSQMLADASDGEDWRNAASWMVDTTALVRDVAQRGRASNFRLAELGRELAYCLGELVRLSVADDLTVLASSYLEQLTEAPSGGHAQFAASIVRAAEARDALR